MQQVDNLSESQVLNESTSAKIMAKVISHSHSVQTFKQQANPSMLEVQKGAGNIKKNQVPLPLN